MNDRTDDEIFKSLKRKVKNLPNDRTEVLMDKLEGNVMLTVPEVADLLSVSEKTVRRKIRDGEINGVKIGKSWRVSREAYEQWIKSMQQGDFRIESDVGYNMGTYSGDTPAEALATMHREHGYSVKYNADKDSIEFPDEEMRDLCGDVDDWTITEPA
jgi:excisionase family DNA binding protein